jgi:hypothetical protein
MAADVECVVNGRVTGEKALRRSSRSKTLHLPLSSSDRHVRTLCSVVEPLATMVEVGKTKVAKCSIAALEMSGSSWTAATMTSFVHHPLLVSGNLV